MIGIVERRRSRSISDARVAMRAARIDGTRGAHIVDMTVVSSQHVSMNRVLKKRAKKKLHPRSGLIDFASLSCANDETLSRSAHFVGRSIIHDRPHRPLSPRSRLLDLVSWISSLGKGCRVMFKPIQGWNALR